MSFDDPIRIANGAIKLIEESKTKHWYYRKSHFADTVPWHDVISTVNERSGYAAEDLGELVKFWKLKE